MSSATTAPRAAVVVMKFGGSSVADTARLQQVAALVAARRRAGQGVCVVVSAMGKTTDALLAQARELAREPARRELDMLLSTGERASAALLTMALLDAGVPAISFTGSQAGILTNATHSGARVLEVRPYRVQDELEAGRVVVIAGFQGVSYAREITTLGRGGSDTTAVALAAALDADCEIYSDVDGVKSADPRVVPDTRHIEALSHEEMQELAAAGAKVLNAQAVQFAKSRGIAIYARETGRPDLPGTVVRKDAPAPVGGVRGVAHRERLHALIASDLGHLEPLLAHLEAHHLPSGLLTGFAGGDDGSGGSGSSGGGVWCLIPPEDAHGLQSCLAGLPAGTRPGPDVGAVSLVGQGILDDKHVVRAALGALATAGIAIRGISTSSFRVTFFVAAGPGAAQAARLLHARFAAGERHEPERDALV